MLSGEPDPVIGIITALPKEYAAVHAMLDEPADVSRGGPPSALLLEAVNILEAHELSGRDHGLLT